MTMVERMARAIGEAQSGPWDFFSPAGKDALRAEARAALSAMMDTPFAVKMAGAQAITAEHMKANANYDAACDAWRALVRAALDEGEAA